jgi:flagellar protein FlbD
MIRLTRIDGEPFILNADLIRYVEARPDTFITLTTGERVVVAETMDEVLERAVAYQQTKNLIPSPPPVAPGRTGTPTAPAESDPRLPGHASRGGPRGQ